MEVRAITKYTGISAQKARLIVNEVRGRQAEEALEYERYLLHSWLDCVPDAIYFKDSESRFIRVSRSLGEKFGLDASTSSSSRGQCATRMAAPSACN